ncbi:hypothetical protein CGRA01v4_04694 [Colletotrichum graminicola]|nr:hypothetical protein CGRA01v4_04694 [Colletotrichum graminicola]
MAIRNSLRVPTGPACVLINRRSTVDEESSDGQTERILGMDQPLATAFFARPQSSVEALGPVRVSTTAPAEQNHRVCIQFVLSAGEC